MTIVSEVFDVNLDGWVPGARMFSTDDDRFFIVDSDVVEHPVSRMIKYVRRPTYVIFCDAEGAVDMSVSAESFDPGTTAEVAVAALGFELNV